ncbi:hypothetical protein K9L97_04245 [Candidatus Woesearchaeota archaeon]|nr:hypothetical protein [Candidatus Woesearchaeota archaeon]
MRVRLDSRTKSLFEGFSIFVLVLLLFIVVFTGMSTSSPLFLVFIGFSPAIFTVIVSILVFEESFKGNVIIWFLPFVVLALFFLVVTSQSILSSNLNIGALLAINIFICILYVGCALFLVKVLFGKKDSVPKKVVVPSKIKEFISSLEDKSKAINFVIGRVYSKYHGGSKELRELIQIESDWYNEFSENLKNETGDVENLSQIRDHKKLINLLYTVNKIYDRLALFKNSELSVFGSRINGLKNLERDGLGHDLVLDVLIKNDKDPVESYYGSAIKLITDVRNQLNSMIKK